MSEVSSELLSGLLMEAQNHIDVIRETLDRINGQPDTHALQAIQDEVNILFGAAEMLELTPVVDLLAPFSMTLSEVTKDGWNFTDETHATILTFIENLERCFEDLKQPDEPAAPEEKPSPAAGPRQPRPDGPGERPLPEIVFPDLPGELAEIFAVEAQDHIRAIQSGMELLRKSPGDQAMLADLRRATHTLKGAAGAVGFTAISSTAHLMEDLVELHLDGSARLSPEEIGLLLDTTDLLEALLDPGRIGEAQAMIANTLGRYPALLNTTDESQPPAPAQPAAEPQAAPAAPAPPQSANLLRLPIENVDLLINRVGEIVINRNAFERHLGTMRSLLTDLDYSARRLTRLAMDISTQIELAKWGNTGPMQPVDTLFDPIEMDQYTLLHQYARELMEATTDAGDINTKLRYLTDDFDGVLVRERRLTTEVQNGLMVARLVSFREIETRLRQAVRRTSQTLNKQVELNLVGFDTQVDKQVLETLIDPLMHLIRNAIDHGIEPPYRRVELDKNPVGLITISVLRVHGRVIVSLSDDGSGIDSERVQQRAILSGLLKPGDEAASDAVIDLLFLDGFSAAETVTETSGRGVGLSIVRRAVNSLQGTIKVETRPGAGTTFVISVPVTLAITRALYIQSCDQFFAIPLEQISGVTQLTADTLAEYREKGVIHHNKQTWSVYDLATYVRGNNPTPHYGLMVEAESQATIVFVHRLAGIHETVVKSLGAHLRRVHGVAGATISGDGRVILILDLPELIAEERGEEVEPVREPPRKVSTPKDKLHVLVVDDSPSVRRVVSSFLERNGWRATLAKDGIDALEKLATVRPDVALVDIEMPRMNGYELLNEIKTAPELKGIPVVFLTSRAAAKHRQRAEQLHVDGYLVKPYHEEQLIAELLRVAQKS